MGPKRKGPKLPGPMTPITVPKDPIPDTTALQEKYGLSNQTTLTINGQNYPCTTNELTSIAELGRGMFVCVCLSFVGRVNCAIKAGIEIAAIFCHFACSFNSGWVCFNKETLQG